MPKKRNNMTKLQVYAYFEYVGLEINLHKFISNSIKASSINMGQTHKIDVFLIFFSEGIII